MSWRTIIISTKARLSIKNNQLILSREEEISIPLEDISSLMLENRDITITTYLLSELAKQNIAVFICDEKHLPCGILTGFQPHSRQYKIMKAQINMTEPFMKNCWKEIIKQKITNQAICLKLLNKPSEEKSLQSILKKIKSGDISNQEAYAAQLYFKTLLDCENREKETTINAALDYGYAVLRGAVARTLTGYGFLPAMGIHHCNERNPFNLADDFIEPFRPVIDLWAFAHIKTQTDDLTPKLKIELTKLLHVDIKINQGNYTILGAIDQTIASFSTACQEQNPKRLKLPILIPLHQHQNE